MTTWVLLSIEDDAEARRLIEDMAEYPDHPLLSPIQENTVSAVVVTTLGGGEPEATDQVDTLAAQVDAAETFARSRAMGAHAVGDFERERPWLDLLAIIERAGKGLT